MGRQEKIMLYTNIMHHNPLDSTRFSPALDLSISPLPSDSRPLSLPQDPLLFAQGSPGAPPRPLQFASSHS